MGSEGAIWVVCNVCGAVAGNYALHDAWHAGKSEPRPTDPNKPAGVAAVEKTATTTEKEGAA